MLQPFLFRPGDAADLVRKALELLAQRDRWPALSAGARRYVAEQRTWRRSVAGYIDVYANQSPYRVAT
jgi:glycogen synthase